MYTPKRLSSKSVELARIRRTLPPPLDLAPEIEPPHPLLKLKGIRIFTVSYKDSVGNQPVPWAYSIGVQSKPKSGLHIYIYECRYSTKYVGT